ncbi:MAG: UDP-N-acetylmuramate dehydrogenase [Firmicutes bacterium]|nr:UDP-N-acetylmuramate dehydrogenase [Bacillota bacterium]HAL62814.1 UDP-N-acetylenolpyruvoylglucosamine reductase [Clostridiales bacterium]
MNVIKNEPMKNHTSFKIGGIADEFCAPSSIEEIVECIKYAKKKNIPYFVIGNGSNILVSDKGIRGLVIKISGEFSRYEICGDIIKAQSGVLLSVLAKAAQKDSLSGMEFASGIPGTLGGAVYMNAGAYGGEMSDIVKSVTYLENGEIKKIENGFDFGYRKSLFAKIGAVVLEAELQLKKGNTDEIKAKMEDYKVRRTEKQPLNFPSAGSVFKRPEGHFAGGLIEDAGLKGFETGGAKVSEKHAGFIINTGDATASDVLKLIKHIQKTVKEKYGVELETEVKLMGEF